MIPMRYFSDLDIRIQQKIQLLKRTLDGNYSPANYYTSRYYNTPFFQLRPLYDSDSLWSFNNSVESDIGRVGTFNGIKSVVDTHVSRIGNTSLLPMVNTIQGNYKTRKILRNLRLYIKQLFSNYNLHFICTNTYRNAVINGVAYIYTDPFYLGTQGLGMWECAISESEKRENTLTHCLIRKDYFPVTLLSRYCKDEKKLQRFEELKYVGGCCIYIYLDCIAHCKMVLCENELLSYEEYNADFIPVTPLYFNTPLKGNKSTSLVEDLDALQYDIDELMGRDSEAVRLSPSPMILYNINSQLTKSSFSTRSGTLYGLNADDIDAGIKVVNPSILDPGIESKINEKIQKMFDQAGVSRLSTQGQIPSANISGVSLQAIENIQDTRFRTQFEALKKSYSQIIKNIIKLKDPGELVLPEIVGRAAVTWGEVQGLLEKVQIQFSEGALLNEDPSVTLETILSMSQTGKAPMDRLQTVQEFPDKELFFSSNTTSIDTIDAIIDNAIEKEIYEIPDYLVINFRELVKELIILEQQFFSYEEEAIFVDRIARLDEYIGKWGIEHGLVPVSPENRQMVETQIKEGQDIQLQQQADESALSAPPEEQMQQQQPADIAEVTNDSLNAANSTAGDIRSPK